MWDVQQALGKYKAIPNFSMKNGPVNALKQLSQDTGNWVLGILWGIAILEIAIKLIMTIPQWWNPIAWIDLALYTVQTLVLPVGMQAMFETSQNVNLMRWDSTTGTRKDDGGTPLYYRHIARPKEVDAENLAVQQYWIQIATQMTDMVLTVVTGALWRSGFGIARLIVVGMGAIAGAIDASVWDPLNPIREDQVSYKNIAYLGAEDIQVMHPGEGAGRRAPLPGPGHPERPQYERSG